MGNFDSLEVLGSGHHERSEFAGKVVESLSKEGFCVAVEADLRPRLAADLEGMLKLGAHEVLLYAKGMIAKVVPGPEVSERTDLEQRHDSNVEIVVRLIPSGGLTRVIEGSIRTMEVRERILTALSADGISLEKD